MMPGMGACGVLVVVAQLATAQSPSPRALFEEATALFEKGEFEGAAERFEASFDLRPVPATKFNAARSWEKANKPLKAIGAWQAWLAFSPPSAPQRSEAEAALRALGQKLSNQGVQALTITSLPLFARVSVDGVPRGVAPVTVELVPTRHLVRLDLEGREPVERSIDFSLEAPRVEHFDLVPLGQTPPPQPLALTPAPLVPRPLPRPEVPRPTDPAFALQLSDDVVQVHIESDHREARLFRVAGNPGGECRAPCDLPISRASDTFWIGGAGIVDSVQFVLSDHRYRGRASVNVKAGSAGVRYGLGLPLLTLGLTGIGLGIVFGILRSGVAEALLGVGLGSGAVVGAIVAQFASATTITFDL